jgi:hypothetical protein
MPLQAHPALPSPAPRSPFFSESVRQRLFEFYFYWKNGLFSAIREPEA